MLQQLFLQTLTKILDDKNAAFLAKRHREQQKKSNITPNFAYAFEFFECEWYEYTRAEKLNSMLFESSLSVVNLISIPHLP